MKTIKFRLTQSRCYEMVEYTDSSIQVLDYILPELEESTGFKRWAQSNDKLQRGTNFGLLDRKKNHIWIYSQVPADDEVPLVLTIDSFVKMIDDWFYLVRQKVPVIVIKYENETAFVGTE